MASIETKQQFVSLIAHQRNPLIKTSAEIVNEARRSLRVQATQRPFTPVKATRELFGNSDDCTRTRPPSTFRFDTHFSDFMTSKKIPSDKTFWLFAAFMLIILMLLSPDQFQLLAFPDWNMYVLSVYRSYNTNVSLTLLMCLSLLAETKASSPVQW